MIKKIKSILFVLTVLTISLSFAQDSLVRENRPFTVKMGSEGFGMDFSYLNYFASDFTTIAFYHSFKTRIFLLQRNASPFIGIGVGSYAGFMSDSNANKWLSFQLGWEHSYEVIQLQFYLQHPISTEKVRSTVPLTYNLSVGMRVLY